MALSGRTGVAVLAADEKTIQVTPKPRPEDASAVEKSTAQAPLEPGVGGKKPALRNRQWQRIAIIAMLIGLVLGGLWVGFRSPVKRPDPSVIPVAPLPPVTETPQVVKTPPVVETPPVAGIRQSFAPEMVWIPGGCFQMGSPASEQDRDDDERCHPIVEAPPRRGIPPRQIALNP